MCFTNNQLMLCLGVHLCVQSKPNCICPTEENKHCTVLEIKVVYHLWGMEGECFTAENYAKKFLVI